MNLSIKNLKIHKDMSDETLCFSATLYADGKKVCTVSNHGQGGPNAYGPINEQLYKEVQEFAKSQKIVYNGIEINFEKLDCLVDELITKMEYDREIQKSIKRGKTPFRLKSDSPTSFRELNGTRGEKAIAWLRSKYGDQVDAIY